MAKQDNDYTTVPAARVAQLLSLGTGYEGYVAFDGKPPVFVNISRDPRISLSPQEDCPTTIVSVDIPNAKNPTQIESSTRWIVEGLKIIQTTNTGVGLAAGVVEHSGLTGRMRWSKRGRFSPKYYGDGWGGGSKARIKTYNYKITTRARGVGRGSFLIGIVFDVGFAIAGEQSATKAAVNIAFSAIGTFGGVPGLIIYGLYWGLDSMGAFKNQNHGVARRNLAPGEIPIPPQDATRIAPKKIPIDVEPQYDPNYPRQVIKQGVKK